MAHINVCRLEALIDIIVAVSGASRRKITTNLVKQQGITTVKEFQDKIDSNGLNIYKIIEAGKN